MSIIDKMKGMSREELLALAVTQGVTVHWKAKPETIIKAIVDKMANPVQQPEVKHTAEKPAAPVDNNTVEDVEAMLAPIKARIPEFTATYDTDENTWYFRCKGAEECGNMAIPMRVIKMKAQTVSRGRQALLGMNDHFDKLAASGKNAYTNTVIGG